MLSVPITVIGANFDEETREQHRINQLRKRVQTLEKLRIQERLIGGVISDTSVAGMQQINCLLEVCRRLGRGPRSATSPTPGSSPSRASFAPSQDHRTNVMADLKMHVAKSEATFTQLVRKVVIHSRVFAPQTDGGANDRSGTVVPDNAS